MGLVGPGFVGAHHIDAVRRLGFVDVVAIAASTDASARRKADALGVPEAVRQLRSAGRRSRRARGPQHHAELSARAGDPRRARAAASTSISDKPLAMTAADARALLRRRDAGRRRPRGDVQLPRQPAGAAGARDGRRRRARPGPFRPRRLPAGLAAPGRPIFPGGSSRTKAAQSSAVGDIGSHWCDLVQHVAGQRIVEVLADLTTVVATRLKPASSTEAFARRGRDGARSRSPFSSEDLATILVRFDGGAKGTVSVGQVCAGHKNDLWFEVNGRQASLRWQQERQNELWIGRRDTANAVLAKDPSLLAPGARAYAHLPGGHQEGVGRRVLQRHARHLRRSSPPASAGDRGRRRSPRSKTAIIPRASSTPILESHRARRRRGRR